MLYSAMHGRCRPVRGNLIVYQGDTEVQSVPTCREQLACVAKLAIGLHLASVSRQLMLRREAEWSRAMEHGLHVVPRRESVRLLLYSLFLFQAVCKIVTSEAIISACI